jgi:predicted extracellular nuclease
LFSLSQQTITPASGTVTDKIITITYAPTAPGSHAATLTLSSSGATDVIRNLTGTASLAQPTVTGASNIGKTGLTLNWNAVTGATEYEVNVYTKTTGTVTATDLFISEYVEGSSSNKYLEIYNGTGSDIDLSNYQLLLFSNGAQESSPTYTVDLSGTLSNGNTIVYKNSSAALTLPDGVTATNNAAVNFNGDDAIALKKISTGAYVDIFGGIGEDPGTEWKSGSLSTLDQTLVRKSNVTSGVTTNPASGFPTLATEWDGYSKDDVTHLGSHTMDGFGTINTPITSSPFTVSATSLQITGLTAATTYYYTVTAKNGSYVSPASDEASAATLGTATSNVAVRGIFVRNGQVVVTAPAAGERIEIFNAVGQRLVSKLATAGENIISVSAKGVLVVKFGSEVTKVIVP